MTCSGMNTLNNTQFFEIYFIIRGMFFSWGIRLRTENKVYLQRGLEFQWHIVISKL